MRNKKILVIGILLMLILFGVNYDLSYAKKNIDLVDEIINLQNGNISESGIKTSYKFYGDGEVECLRLLREMQLSTKSDINVLKEEGVYCIEFSKGNISGYIEQSKSYNDNYITISIIEKDNINNIEKLKNKVEKAIGNKKSTTTFRYIKAKIEDKDLNKVNKNIAQVLKDYGSENIETVKINNGYSTVAYTKKYEVMRNNNKWMDFNYAVCNYNSGNYLIIGTPQIIESY